MSSTENVRRAEIETRLQHREIADQIREDVIADFMRFGVDRLRAMHYFDLVFPWVVGGYVAGMDGAARLPATTDAEARALEDAADAIQALHPGEVKNSVTFLRDRAATYRAGLAHKAGEDK